MSIIAISRGTFSGGEALAKLVAERLGYRCLSREMNIESAAQQYRLPMDELKDAMDRRPSWEDVHGERSAYLTFVRATLCQQAVRGRLVYHGYLGQLLLPGISHVVSVRVIADREFRVLSAMHQHRLTREGALAYITSVDKERKEWTRFLFSVDWEDPALYDLVVNLRRVTAGTAAEMVAQMADRTEFQPTTESEQALQDLALRSRISAALAGNVGMAGAEVTVAAAAGVVTITGRTRWAGLPEAISAVVRPIEGVKDLTVQIALVPISQASAA